MEEQELIRGMTLFIALLISLSIHEWAHAYTAWKLGDETAGSMGRLTLNPMAHIDLLGTVVMPLLMIFGGLNYLFGWAKPVPVDPTRFRKGVSRHMGMLITSLAGPASNMVLAVLVFFFLRVADSYGPGEDRVFEPIVMAGMINILLAVFNMLPVPPLDGHRILPSWLQDAMAPYSMFIFIGLIVTISTFGYLLSGLVMRIGAYIWGFMGWLI